MKHYFAPEFELMTVRATDVIATSLNVANEYDWGNGDLDKWDWSI